MTMFAQQFINGMTIGMIYALIALGYSMVYGVLKMINFAHGDLCVVGAMFSLVVLRWTGVITGRLNSIAMEMTTGRVIGVLLLTFVSGMAFSALVSLIIERFAYRPLRKASVMTQLISALGISIVLENLMMLVFGREVKGFPTVLQKNYFEVFGARFSNLQLLIAAVTAVLLVGLFWLVNKTTLGR